MWSPKRVAAAWILTDLVWALVFLVVLKRHLQRRRASEETAWSPGPS